MTDTNQLFSRLTAIKHCVSGNVDYTDCTVTLQNEPFRHVMLHKLLDEQFYMNLKNELLQLKFYPKECDLFKLRQSCDLGNIGLIDDDADDDDDDDDDDDLESLKLFVQFLKIDLKSWICSVFDIQLTDEVNVSGSIYNQTDYLLCHDDKLEGRKIAFIYYLVDEDWNGWKDGGNLRLFSCFGENFTPRQEPCKIISPSSNTFVMFEVVPGSYHDVSEVLTNRSPRLALSGWFHTANSFKRSDEITDPVPSAHKMCRDLDLDQFVPWVNDSYVDQTDIDRILRIRQAFEDESILELNDFFTSEWIEAVFNTKEKWFRLPANQCPVFARYKRLDEKSGLFGLLLGLMRHEMMFALLCQLTGVDLHPDSTALLSFGEEQTPQRCGELSYCCEFELRKIEKGFYSILTDRHKSQKSPNLSNGKMINGTTKHENANFKEEDDGFSLYLHSFFLPKGTWDETWGGFVVYVDEEGEEIQRIIPKHNCLTLAYVDSETKSFLKYVNGCAGNNVYYHLIGRFYVDTE